MIKNIIFDWSGVIDDNIKTHYCASMEVLKAFDVKRISMKKFREEFDLPYMSFYKKYNSKITKKKQDEIFKSAFPKCPKSRLYPGMKSLLGKCKRSGKKLFLVTSDHKIYLTKLLNQHGVIDCFDVITYSVHEKRKQLIKMIKRYKLRKNQTLYVGDTIHEIKVCKDLKIVSTGVTWGVCPELKMKKAKPDYIFHNLKEMEKVILET